MPDPSASRTTASDPSQTKSTGPLLLNLPPSVPALSTLPAYAPSRPSSSSFAAPHLCAGGGVAIFHIASARVVLCYYPPAQEWFLPKGRRDAGEETKAGAEREGFEESGYRNRILPLPIAHLQPPAESVVFEAIQTAEGVEFVQKKKPARALSTEPTLTQFLPLSRNRQYLLHWFVAETLPPAVEAELDNATKEIAQKHGLDERRVYVRPPAYPEGLGLRERVTMDVLERGKNGEGGEALGGVVLKEMDGRQQVYEPVWHAGTGVDEEEQQYESYLVPVDEAIGRLNYGMDWVVKWGWECICKRWEEEG